MYALTGFVHVAMVVVAFLGWACSTASGDDKRSPFQFVRWKDREPEVRIQRDWYHVVSIGEKPIAEILRFAREKHENRWQKRFNEDLPQLMREIGMEVGETVSLTLRSLKTGEIETKTDVPMTEENRNAIYSAHRFGTDHRIWFEDTPPIVRRHAENALNKPLTRRIESSQPWAAQKLSAEGILEDLDDLEWHLTNRYSYVERVGYDYRSDLDAIRAAVGDGMSRGAFMIQIKKLLCGFGDGHTRIWRWMDSQDRQRIPWSSFLPGGFIPVKFNDGGGGVVVHAVDPKSLLDDSMPFVTAIDGIAIHDWMSAAARIVSRGTPQFIHSQSLSRSVFAGYIRAELGLPNLSEVSLELASRDGKSKRNVSIDLSEAPAFPRRPPWISHRKLDNEFGYLRITKMEDDIKFDRELFDAMAALRDTRGLIIDVRDNRGGSREPLRNLFPFFMKSDDEMHVVNVAAYRLPPTIERSRKEGYLQNRFLYPATSEYWTGEERLRLEEFSKSFKPELSIPKERFSELHFFAIHARASEGYYHYDKPVVVLMNEACYSATDIFLGAFTGWRNVTLMGSPSGGGSGRATHRVKLRTSGFVIQMSSMASFRPDGKLYDGRGIQPDIHVSPGVSDIVDQTDSILDAATRYLKRSARRNP